MKKYAEENEMSINYKKTKMILFNPGSAKDFHPRFNLGNNEIDLFEETRLQTNKDPDCHKKPPICHTTSRNNFPNNRARQSSTTSVSKMKLKEPLHSSCTSQL